MKKLKKLIIILALIPVLSFGQDTTLILIDTDTGVDSTFYPRLTGLSGTGIYYNPISIWEPPDSVSVGFNDTIYWIKNDVFASDLTLALMKIYTDECYRAEQKMLCYKGTMDGFTGIPTVGGCALIDGTGEDGDFYRVMYMGVYDYGNPHGNKIILKRGDDIIYDGKIWKKKKSHNKPTFPGFIEWLKKK